MVWPNTFCPYCFVYNVVTCASTTIWIPFNYQGSGFLLVVFQNSSSLPDAHQYNKHKTANNLNIFNLLMLYKTGMMKYYGGKVNLIIVKWEMECFTAW